MRAVIVVVALCSTLAVAGDAGTELSPMRKQDFVAPVFADGPRLDEAGFLVWVNEPREVKLPFTIWRNPKRVGAIGLHDAHPAQVLTFDDTALGISLDERLRQLCGGETPCRVWLSGRFSGAKPATRFKVLAVHERVVGDGPHRAQSVRGDACLAIRSLRPMHCARGPGSCDRCKLAQAQPAAVKLLDVCPWGDVSRPVIELRRAGEKVVRPYDVLRTFSDEAEARAFAEQHHLTDVEL